MTQLPQRLLLVQEHAELQDDTLHAAITLPAWLPGRLNVLMLKSHACELVLPTYTVSADRQAHGRHARRWGK